MSLAWFGVGQALAAVVIGLVRLVTAATGTCQIYAALGLSTADRSSEDEAMPGKPA